MSKKKTGRLTKVEKFYIENNTDKSAEDIAKDLNRSKSTVIKYLGNSNDTGHQEQHLDIILYHGHQVQTCGRGNQTASVVTMETDF